MIHTVDIVDICLLWYPVKGYQWQDLGRYGNSEGHDPWPTHPDYESHQPVGPTPNFCGVYGDFHGEHDDLPLELEVIHGNPVLEQPKQAKKTHLPVNIGAMLFVQ